MPDSIKAPLIENVDDVCLRLNERKQVLIEKISSIEAELDTVENIDDLLAVKDDVDELLGYHFEKVFSDRLGEIDKSIDSVRAKIEDIPDTLDEVEELAKKIKAKNPYDRVYLSSLMEVKDKLLIDEQQWIIKTLEPAEITDSLDAQQCAQFIEKLRNVPTFVSSKTNRRVKKAIVNVEKKLHECKVQGVYSLFNALSEEEKEEFLKLINRF
jgi:hypothetical protein